MSKKDKETVRSKVAVNERCSLKEAFCNEIRAKKAKFGFGGFGEAVYYRTYSQIKSDGTQEHWADTVISVINGVISVRKNHYALNRLAWNEKKWNSYAKKLTITMFDMK